MVSTLPSSLSPPPPSSSSLSSFDRSFVRSRLPLSLSGGSSLDPSISLALCFEKGGVLDCRRWASIRGVETEEGRWAETFRSFLPLGASFFHRSSSLSRGRFSRCLLELETGGCRGRRSGGRPASWLLSTSTPPPLPSVDRSERPAPGCLRFVSRLIASLSLVRVHSTETSLSSPSQLHPSLPSSKCRKTRAHLSLPLPSPPMRVSILTSPTFLPPYLSPNSPSQTSFDQLVQTLLPSLLSKLQLPSLLSNHSSNHPARPRPLERSLEEEEESSVLGGRRLLRGRRRMLEVVRARRRRLEEEERRCKLEQP